ncbi:MAG: hypothetical protein JNM60_12055 [Candidatus Competibacteraceae bacterium]|nr:hypothetical protein [Candidatus Competibacteraceae bacterium]
MISSHAVAFNALPVSMPDVSGEPHLQVAAFFRKRLYAGVLDQDGGDASIARLLRYYPGAERWEIVYETAVSMPERPRQRRRQPFALELGWRAIASVPGERGREALCLSLLCAHQPRLLYSGDGEAFDVLLPDGGEARPLGPLHAFQGWLFGALAGAMSDGIAEKPEGGALLYACRDPLAGRWVAANAPGFGDPHNQVVHGFQVFNGWLYAAVGNPFAGFQLWRTQAQGEPPFDWERALDRGAQRYTFNSAAATMAVFRDALYIGTGVPLTEDLQDEAAGCELIRVLPDGRWELAMGQPRFSPLGLQVPVSAHGPGFDDPAQTALTSLASSGDALYAVTLARDPETVSGFQLWRTADGERWRRIATPADHGCASCLPRALIALPKFLLVGGDRCPNPTDDRREPFIWLGKSEC